MRLHWPDTLLLTLVLPLLAALAGAAAAIEGPTAMGITFAGFAVAFFVSGVVDVGKTLAAEVAYPGGYND